MSDIDFLAIGDIVVDDFIQLKDVRIDTKPDEGDRGMDELCFRFGDKVEFEESKVVYAVGNAANAAISAARLGAKSALLADVGSDELGERNIATLKENGVDTTWMKTHEGMKSNFHYVLRYGPERTILIKHHEYPYALPENIGTPRYAYFSSVGEHGFPYHEEIAAWLKSNPSIKLAFQPGTLQIKLGYEKLRDLYEATEVFFCNKEEAQSILESTEDDVVSLLKAMHERGPEVVVITDGKDGAFAYDGEGAYHMPMYPDPAKPVDRTGAGDSFASTFTVALSLGEDIQTALSWGPINSMSVVQYVGAQEGLLSRDALLEYLKKAPDTYKAEKVA